MPKGGYQKPKGAQPASGPGKFSKRTDAQKVATPRLSGSDLQYGDVQRLQAAQKVAPLPEGVPQPKVPRVQPQPVGRTETLPPWLFESESTRPNEPVTTGLSSGPGAGPEALRLATPPQDPREVVLQYLYETFDNEDALQMLTELRAARGTRGTQGAQSAPQTPQTPPRTPPQAATT